MSTITSATHPFYEKHHEIIKSIWSIDKNNSNVDQKLARLKEATKSTSPNQLFDIYDEKTGESRARVTPLIIACFEGDFDTIQFLIDNGVDPNQTESEHNLSAIHILVDGPYKGQTITEQQRAQLIRSMVKNGANVNQLDKYQMAPIHKTVIHDRTQCLEALIEANVDPNVIFMGEIALTIAGRQNRDQIMKRLLNYKETKTDFRNSTGQSVLHFSAGGMIDSSNCIRLLIDSGVPINIQDNRGNTPLILACFFNRPQIVQALLDAHADVTIKNNDGKDAFTICEERESNECKTILQSRQ